MYSLNSIHFIKCTEYWPKDSSSAAREAGSSWIYSSGFNDTPGDIITYPASPLGIRFFPPSGGVNTVSGYDSTPGIGRGVDVAPSKTGKLRGDGREGRWGVWDELRGDLSMDGIREGTRVCVDIDFGGVDWEIWKRYHFIKM